MRPVRVGDRGAAVEDIPLGDRMLYLRLPYFHGHDVELLQLALNALGFTCGAVDRIFGPFTEHAVREFQRNTGLVPDGIAGADTLRAINALRHVWEGKDATAHSAARAAQVRACDGLARTRVAVGGADDLGDRIAQRVANLALAANPDALISVLEPGEQPAPNAAIVVLLCGHGTASAEVGRPVVRFESDQTFEARFITAVAASRATTAPVLVELEALDVDDEHGKQRAAVRVLDTICTVFD